MALSELSEFWKKCKEQGIISFKDWAELERILSSVFIKIDQLEESRDKWREKYEELKKQINLGID